MEFKFKETLAPRNQILSMIVPSFFTLFLLILLVVWSTKYSILIWILGLGLPSSLILLKWKYNQTYNLYFDSKFLHLENKTSQRQIPLNQISTAKELSNRIKVFGFPYQQYVIEYRNEKGVLKKLPCWISTFDNSWSYFMAYLSK